MLKKKINLKLTFLSIFWKLKGWGFFFMLIIVMALIYLCKNAIILLNKMV